jgi:hypothetical protein
MKTLWMKTIVLLFLSAGMAHAQNREEVPGDNFSLEGALELFKKSASPEEFERLLNLPESEVNNLDLNGDGNIDYIRVINHQDGNIHTFTLQAVIARNEFQNIAVISLEKLANGRAILQITGDADVYGIETIIEPTEEVRINAGTTTTRTFINVWSWPCVQYVYDPFYTPWVSPWYWDYSPFWWQPWRPVAFGIYYPRWVVYRPFYRYCDAPRIRYASRIYYPHRATSMIVYNRHREQISTYRSTRTVYGETRGRDDSLDSRTMRYDNRNRTAGTTTRSSSREWSGRDTNRQSSDINRSRREETNRDTETIQWRRSSDDTNTRTERTNSSTNRSYGERSTNQNNTRTYEQPRENRSNNSGSSGNNRPEVRQESRQTRTEAPAQRQSNDSGNQRSSSGSGSGGKRGRD